MARDIKAADANMRLNSVQVHDPLHADRFVDSQTMLYCRKLLHLSAYDYRPYNSLPTIISLA